MSLPITVILPTRNAMGVVERHVETLADLLSAAEEVVVVDSSEDGTLEYLRGKLTAPNVRFYSRPRGLYESWNFAIREARAEFVYISTMGDLASLEGVKHLLEVARRHEADLVISPPHIVREDGGVGSEVRWPVHLLGDLLTGDEGRVLSAEESILYNVSWMPETLIGSSASDLYRRSYLAENPFPEGWGNCADSAWMLAHATKARIAVTPRVVADFVMHPQAPGDDSRHPKAEQYADLFVRAETSVREGNFPDGVRDILLGWVVSLRKRQKRLHEAIAAKNLGLEKLREKVADLSPRLATATEQQKVLSAQLKEAKKCVAQLEIRLGEEGQVYLSLRRTLRRFLSVQITRFRRFRKRSDRTVS